MGEEAGPPKGRAEPVRAARRSRAEPRVGLVYDLLGTAPAGPDAPPDADAEYEPEDTVVLLEEALRRAGAEPVRLGSPRELLAAVGGGTLPPLEAALSIAEGYGTRNREAWAPVLLEMAGVPGLGSDALTLSLSLDKAWTHAVVAAAGVAVPEHAVAHSAEEARALVLPAPFPLFVKPRWEGTAKGLLPSSRVGDREALAREVARVVRDYGQPALVERFLPGAEYTVTVVGHDPPRALPVMQRALEAATGIGLHALDRAAVPAPADGWRHVTPGHLDAALEERLAGLALRAHAALGCRDFSRTDLRLDDDGAPRFLEVNPLPTFARDGTFGILAEWQGRALEDLVAEVLQGALRRVLA
ncbi:MAG: D-alanine--D-alanine ligase [Myxococcota bacterium]|nr:D-alanine--D-alanine ligase [Myxococcota bacterium]